MSIAWWRFLKTVIMLLISSRRASDEGAQSASAAPGGRRVRCGTVSVRDLDSILLTDPKTKTPPMAELPPRVPTALADLDRLIMLLGSRSKGSDLTKAVRAEMIALCGVYPHPTTAALWKRELRQVRAEMNAEPDPEAP